MKRDLIDAYLCYEQIVASPFVLRRPNRHFKCLGSGDGASSSPSPSPPRVPGKIATLSRNSTVAEAEAASVRKRKLHATNYLELLPFDVLTKILSYMPLKYVQSVYQTLAHCFHLRPYGNSSRAAGFLDSAICHLQTFPHLVAHSLDIRIERAVRNINYRAALTCAHGQPPAKRAATVAQVVALHRTSHNRTLAVEAECAAAAAATQDKNVLFFSFLEVPICDYCMYNIGVTKHRQMWHSSVGRLLPAVYGPDLQLCATCDKQIDTSTVDLLFHIENVGDHIADVVAHAWIKDTDVRQICGYQRNQNGDFLDMLLSHGIVMYTRGIYIRDVIRLMSELLG